MVSGRTASRAGRRLEGDRQLASPRCRDAGLTGPRTRRPKGLKEPPHKSHEENRTEGHHRLLKPMMQTEALKVAESFLHLKKDLIF